MNLLLWNKVYLKNKYLDDIFISKYGNDKLLYEKNAIEFLAELSEFINETKCFKYWSIKEPKKDEMLEELADTFTMLLYFYNVLNIEFDNIEITNNNDNLFRTINNTYILGTKLYDKPNGKVLNDIFSNLFNIMIMLNMNEEEIIDAINKKHIKIEERLNSDY